MRRWLPLVALFLVAPVAAVAATVNVSIFNFGFNPQSITVHTGDTVHWTNSSGFHTTTAGDGVWGSGNLNQGQSFDHTFTAGQEGIHTYFCGIHGAGLMSGTVTVDATDVTRTTWQKIKNLYR